MEATMLVPIIILTEQKVYAWVIEFPSLLGCGQFATRYEDRQYQTCRNIRDANPTRFARWQIDLDCLGGCGGHPGLCR